MTRLDACRITLLLLCLVPLGACSGEPAAQADAAEGSAQPLDPQPAGKFGPARPLPIPGQQMPPDHPPLETNAQSTRLHWHVPEGWTEQPPASTMRIAQYGVGGPGGAGECVVYYFGPGQGGDPMSNAVRWARQFTQPDGSSTTDSMQVTELESTRVPVQVVEVSGTYDGGMTMTDQPAENKTGYMLLGGIAMGPDAPWFFKFTGPEATVRHHREAFLGMMRSLHPSP